MFPTLVTYDLQVVRSVVLIPNDIYKKKEEKKEKSELQRTGGGGAWENLHKGRGKNREERPRRRVIGINRVQDAR